MFILSFENSTGMELQLLTHVTKVIYMDVKHKHIARHIPLIIMLIFIYCVH